MILGGKKGSASIRLLGIALGTFMFLVLFKSISFTASLMVILAALIFLTLYNIWSSIPSRKTKKVFSPKTYATSPIHPAAHIFTNASTEVANQSIPEYKISEIAPKRVIEEFSMNNDLQAQEPDAPIIKQERLAKMAEIEKEVEEVLSKYRRSNLYQDYTGRDDSHKGLFELDNEQEKVKESKTVSKFKKLEVKAKPKAHTKAKVQEKKEEPKKNTWVNVSEDKKGKVRFKEEEVESIEGADDEYDPDKEAEEYILKSKSKTNADTFEEADEDDEDQKDEGDLFF